MPIRWCAASSTLPNGTGRTVRVAVFARGAKADEARPPGADVVGAEDLVEQVHGRQYRFRPLHRDARPDAAGRPARQGFGAARHDAQSQGRHRDHGRDRRRAASKGGSVEFRVEKAGIVHAGVGKASFSRRQAGGEHQGLRRCGAEGKAAGAKGHFINRVAHVLDHGAGREDRAGKLVHPGAIRSCTPERTLPQRD